MLGILYIALMIWTGDFLCRRFIRYVSLPHRLATAFLVGLLASSWFTYLVARVFASSMRPLMWGNFFFIIVAGGALAWSRRKTIRSTANEENEVDAIATTEALPQQQQLVMVAAGAGAGVNSTITLTPATMTAEQTALSGTGNETTESASDDDEAALVVERASRLD